MKTDTDIRQIAADMIAQHGSEAENEAANRANRMLDQGDRTRQVKWLRVRIAIVTLGAEQDRAEGKGAV